MAADRVFLGAVAYDPKTVTIWEGFRAWLLERGLTFDFVLFSNYETLAEALLAGQLDVAWNSPLAWVRCRRLAGARGRRAQALFMRDSDRDLTSVVLARSEGPVHSVADLEGKVVAVGAVDSPQATLLPLSALRAAGLEPGKDFEVRHFDVGVGKHGDHIGGEGDAARALMAGHVSAACVLDATQLTLHREGILRPGDVHVLHQTPKFDHCNMTVLESSAALDRFAELLLGMSYDDPVARPLLDLEGLKKWEPGRLEGYEPLERAVDEAAFYDAAGAITARDYRP
jgi:ABC-type phosphate/phosphonate transport system substrate-binding protein